MPSFIQVKSGNRFDLTSRGRDIFCQIDLFSLMATAHVDSGICAYVLNIFSFGLRWLQDFTLNETIHVVTCFLTYIYELSLYLARKSLLTYELVSASSFTSFLSLMHLQSVFR